MGLLHKHAVGVCANVFYLFLSAVTLAFFSFSDASHTSTAYARRKRCKIFSYDSEYYQPVSYDTDAHVDEYYHAGTSYDHYDGRHYHEDRFCERLAALK